MVEATLQMPLVLVIDDGTKAIFNNPVIVASKNLLCCDLPDGAVILDLQSGIYYGLDDVGTCVWSLIQEPKTMSEIVGAVIEQYDVDPLQCGDDLRNLFAEMASRGLIEVRI